MAGWQNGYAEDCKSLYVGSIPAPASTLFPTLLMNMTKKELLSQTPIVISSEAVGEVERSTTASELDPYGPSGLRMT